MTKQPFTAFLFRPFERNLGKFRARAHRSPPAKKALTEVDTLLGQFATGAATTVPGTKHGESRIQNVSKYDLFGHHRFVVWENGGIRIPLFVGSHEEADRWLDHNQGMAFQFKDAKEGGPQCVQLRKVNIRHDDLRKASAIADDHPASNEVETPLTLIDDKDFERFGCDASAIFNLKAKLRTDLDYDTRKLIVNGLFPGDERRQLGLLAAFEHARRGDLDSALLDLAQAAGRVVNANDDPEAFIRALAGWEIGTPNTPLDEDALERVRRLVKGGDADDWMLYLNPAQRGIVDATYTGPSRLLGVSGSGKSSVLLHRASTLARRYPGERILVATLNEALCRYLSHLLDKLCAPTERPRIEVRTVFSVCSQVAEAAGRMKIRQLDPRSGETPKQSWADFVEKHAQEIAPILDAIEADDRAAGCTPIDYIREELVWIRSGWGRLQRSEYDVADRVGRTLPFPKCLSKLAHEQQRGPFPADTRPMLREFLERFEHWMSVGEVYDTDGASILAFEALSKLGTLPDSCRYRCVLVDEVQDVSTLELTVLKAVVAQETDGLFVCGDLAQKVFPKHHDHREAGLNFTGRGNRLEKNYRNTRDILIAAHSLIETFREDAAMEREAILNPEYAVRRGYRPWLFECDSVAQQVELALAIVNDLPAPERSATCIVTHSAETLQLLQNRFRGLPVPIELVLLGPTTRFDSHPNAIRLAHIEDIKGFEFKNVILLDASDPRRRATTAPGGSIIREGYPTSGVAWGERWRDAFRLYVAMSRAREGLYITYVYNRSVLLAPLGDTVIAEKAIRYLGSQPAVIQPLPAAEKAKPLTESRSGGPSATGQREPPSGEWTPSRGQGWDAVDQHGDLIVWGAD